MRQMYDFGEVLPGSERLGKSLKADARDPNPKARYRLLLAALTAMNGGKVRIPAAILSGFPLRARLAVDREGDDFIIEFSEARKTVEGA